MTVSVKFYQLRKFFDKIVEAMNTCTDNESQKTSP